LWFLILASLLQAVAFQFPATRSRIPESWAPVLLIGTQVCLLTFAWINRKQPGFWAMGIGLVLNLAVISLNSGWMPISPETLHQLVPNAPANTFQAGHRFGTSKDWVLELSATRLGWLSDRLVTPAWFPIHAAYSYGDILIGIGAFLLLWSMGAPSESVNSSH
jgi:hypothetical protein